jgi:Protein of unknown function (DUF2726)
MEWLLIGLGIGITLLVWRLFASPVPVRAKTGTFVLPPHVTLQPQPLLTDTELFLYNLMRLAVQDQYLVFTQVPLLSVIRVEAEGPTRSELLQRIALKRLDYVLVHPGSRLVEQVVQLEDDQRSRSHQGDRREVIKAVVESAGIRFTILPPHTSYTIPQLAALLGLGGSE